MAVARGTDLKRNVGRRIAELRRGAGMTQSALAERLELSLQYVQRVEAGKINLTLESLEKWGNAVGAAVPTLLEPPRSNATTRGRPRGDPDLPFAKTSRSRRALPVYRFRPAAGRWSDWQPGGVRAWVKPPPGVAARKGLLLVQVLGKSMEPLVPDGSWCLCSMPWSAPRAREIGIFVRSSAEDVEGGGHFTLKEYAPRNIAGQVAGALKSRNPKYPPIRPGGDDSERPLARLVRVINTLSNAR